MICCKNKEAVVGIFAEAGKPLSSHMRKTLSDAENELIEKNLPLEFVIMEAKCRICGRESICIIPKVNDLENSECSNCGNMTVQEKDEKDWWE